MYKRIYDDNDDDDYYYFDDIGLWYCLTLKHFLLRFRLIIFNKILFGLSLSTINTTHVDKESIVNVYQEKNEAIGAAFQTFGVLFLVRCKKNLNKATLCKVQ